MTKVSMCMQQQLKDIQIKVADLMQTDCWDWKTI